MAIKRYRCMKGEKPNDGDSMSKNDIDSLIPNISQASAINIIMTRDDFAMFIKEITSFVTKTLTEKSDSEKAMKRYTPDEVCEKLGVSKTTLNKWEKVNYLVPNRVGKRVFYRVDDIDRMLGSITASR